MRGPRLAGLACALLGLAACAMRPAADTANIDHPEKEGVPGAVQAPLKDVNLIQTQIPLALRQATAAPYARPSPASCMQIASDVSDLDEALGDDVDVQVQSDPSKAAKRGRQAGEIMVGAMRDAEADFIPFRSWIRLMSGAKRHDKRVRAAVYAGRVRRAYLKGLGEALGCAYPAKPKGASPLPIRAESIGGPPGAASPAPGRRRSGPP